MAAERLSSFSVGGRRLAAHEWGQPDGLPLIHRHGLGTRTGLHVNEVAPILLAADTAGETDRVATAVGDWPAAPSAHG